MPIMKVFVFTVSYCGSIGRLYAYNEGFAVYSLLLLPFATAAQKVVCMPATAAVCYCCSAGRVFQYIYTKLYQRVSANFKICREVVICKGKGWESGRESKGDGGGVECLDYSRHKHA